MSLIWDLRGLGSALVSRQQLDMVSRHVLHMVVAHALDMDDPLAPI